MPLRSLPPAPIRRRLALLAGAIIAALLAAWYWFGGTLATLSPQQTQSLSAPHPATTATASAASAGPPTTAVQERISPSGIPIHLKRPPRLSVPPPPYGPAYAQLEPLARAGDNTAQYRLGLLLYECRDVPAEAAQLDQTIEHTYETRRRGGWDVDDPAEEEQTLRRRFAECEGVPAQQRGLYRDWLKQAADSGLVEAQLDLPLHLPQGEYCQYMSECSPQQAAVQEALQREAVDYLGRARDAGSANALWTFAAWYSEGDVLPQDNVEAYANFSALDQVFAAAGEPTRFGMMLDDLRSQMRPIDLEQADARMRELLSNPNCCLLLP
jgi:hypothetical protein